jgi:hypothetical protein
MEKGWKVPNQIKEDLAKLSDAVFDTIFLLRLCRLLQKMKLAEKFCEKRRLLLEDGLEKRQVPFALPVLLSLLEIPYRCTTTILL